MKNSRTSQKVLDLIEVTFVKFKNVKIIKKETIDRIPIQNELTLNK